MKKIIVSAFLLTMCAIVSAQTDHSVLQEAGLGEIKAGGWLKETLITQSQGLTGHMPVVGNPFHKEGWGFAEQKQMRQWEDFEQTAYWADGALRLGYFTDNRALTQQVRDWVEFQLQEAKPDGFLGPELNNLWPHVVFFRVMMAEYSVTKDPRIIEALSRNYKDAARCKLLIKTDGQDFDFNERTMLHIEILCWLYQQTGDRFFLDKAEHTYKIFCSQSSPFTMQAFASEQVPIVHSVSSSETLKIPVILYLSTGKKEYLDAALHGLKKVYAYHGLADGVPSGNEAHDWNKPNAVHETCDISDAQWMLGYFVQATGDVQWADLMEKICFNGALGVVTEDFKSMQYYSSPNQVIATQNSSPCTFIGGVDRMAYRISHGPSCCNGNMNRMIPLFCSRQWMKKGDDGIAAVLYGPSELKTQVQVGKKSRSVSIREQTNYPFDEHIRFTIEVAQPTEFSLWLRIPAWCEGASIRVNGVALHTFCQAGSFAQIRRAFKQGDCVELRLPMKAKFVEEPCNGVSVQRGPLLFSLPVGAEQKIVETRTHEGVEFHSYFMTPTSKWNYAIDSGAAIEQITSGDFDRLWNPQTTPVRLRVRATEVLNWQLYRGVFTPDMPTVINPGEECVIELVPIGATLLRVSVFPDPRKIPALDF